MQVIVGSPAGPGPEVDGFFNQQIAVRRSSLLIQSSALTPNFSINSISEGDDPSRVRRVYLGLALLQFLSLLPFRGINNSRVFSAPDSSIPPALAMVFLSAISSKPRCQVREEN
jgi:hypothetical protein